MKNKISKFVLLLFLIVIISMFVKGYLYKKEVEDQKTKLVKALKGLLNNDGDEEAGEDDGN